MRLIATPPGKIVDGQIVFEGRDLLKLSDEEMRKIRGNRIAMIFQEPMTSLNPVLTIGEQIAEAVILHQRLDKRAAWERAIEMLERVKMPAARQRVKDYPHQFSGGMRQRVMIAMALSCNPSVLLADEPTTALDVTIQAQILELMRELQREFGTAIVMITHNLGVVAEMCDNVVVMYAGRPIEAHRHQADVRRPRHPYTWGLLHSVPKTVRAQRAPDPDRGAAPEPRGSAARVLVRAAVPVRDGDLHAGRPAERADRVRAHGPVLPVHGQGDGEGKAGGGGGRTGGGRRAARKACSADSG